MHWLQEVVGIISSSTDDGISWGTEGDPSGNSGIVLK